MEDGQGADPQGENQRAGRPCSPCPGDQQQFQEAGVSGWGHGKDAKGGNRIWSQFPRALNVELRSLVFYARQRGASGGCM